MNAERVRLYVDGTVQGVGFRPYVFRLARGLELTGFVRNDVNGVVIEIEGAAASVDRFVSRLPMETPVLAICERIARQSIEWRGDAVFTIVESAPAGLQESGATALVSPDVATCDDCLRELLDPTDRRYRYPFINCTNCGPRFTIVRGVPYDRPLTTMVSFRMCPACESEYGDPDDRRFHAQPNACPACGPVARLVTASGATIGVADTTDPIAQAAAACRAGSIVAVKGVGGYHLACLASDERAISALRDRKHRPDKPFALMAPDMAWARQLVELDAVEEALLAGRERPILLARRRQDAPVGASVAPHQRELGVMLPYSPLHHLLLRDVGAPLVMTSGNVSDEPIAFRDDDALARLAGIADVFLIHNRPIETPTDDSVVRVLSANGRRTTMVRRSRGFAPTPLTLPIAAPVPILACGAQLKNTYGFAVGERAWVGPHIGDLERYETLQAFTAGIGHHERLFGIVPEEIAHDLHPEYLSTKYAVARADAAPAVRTAGVQHHHAHFAACLAEHGETGPAIGVIFDGTGLGASGGDGGDGGMQPEVWGGEILIGDLHAVERAGHLWPVRMPGGEAAIREPWRMACAWLAALSPDGLPTRPDVLRDSVSDRAWQATARLAHSGLVSPWTTSAGRLFDAVAVLCGIRARISYEGQAAIELEAVADPDEHGRYPVPLVEDSASGVGVVLDVRELVRCVVREVEAGVATELIAARAHDGVAYAVAECCRLLAARRGLSTVVLSGGVFQNRLLVERTVAELNGADLRVLIPERLPFNDGGIAFGQLAVAAARSVTH